MRRIVLLTLLLLTGCVTAPPSGTGSPPAVRPAPPAPAAEPAESSAPTTATSVATATPAEPVRKATSPHVLSLGDFADRNDEHLLSVYPGMSRATVDRIMGDYRSGSWTNPYKRQQIAAAGGRTYEILFYLTRRPRAANRVSEGNMTPVIFENDRVTAIGRYPLKKLRRAVCEERGEAACP